ncbi:MAG: LysR family transcriptional regulator, partial [Pseudomonadota bacterium]
MLNYHHLRLFRAVAHEGNLTRSADKLALSQSALSTQIKKLEDSLGVSLFNRKGRQLVLTEAGRIALDHADAIFAVGDELVQTVKG